MVEREVFCLGKQNSGATWAEWRDMVEADALATGCEIHIHGIGVCILFLIY